MILGQFYDVDSYKQSREAVHQIPFKTTTEMLHFSNVDVVAPGPNQPEKMQIICLAVFLLARLK